MQNKYLQLALQNIEYKITIRLSPSNLCADHPYIKIELRICIL